MKLKITRAIVWAAGIEDRPAGLAEKLASLASAGANFEFILARRAPESPGRGVVFVSPIKGAGLTRAATKAGFLRANSLHSLRVEGKDRCGICARISEALAASGINLRGFSACTIGKNFVAHLAFDDIDEMKAAMRAMKRLKL